MGKYEINFKRLVRLFLPKVFEQQHGAVATIGDWCYVLLSSFRTLFFGFKQKLIEWDKQLSYNSQYPNLQRLLNDFFDKDNRAIKVYDGEQDEDFLLIYLNADQKPVILGQVIVNDMTKYDGYEGFIVEVPSYLNTADDILKIRKMVDSYMFLGVKYKIVS
jgi:hypothetical protein